MATDQLLHRFDPIRLDEMDRVKLQVRSDTKFVFGEQHLGSILTGMLPEYRLLHVGGSFGTEYRTLSLDGPELPCYLAHHNGRSYRSKVRFREYLGSDLAFLEVKRKTGRGGTDKARMQVAAIPDRPSPEELVFIGKASGLDLDWTPVLWNRFGRLTFVHRTRAERLTIDRRITFEANGKEAALTGICIAELKEEQGTKGSPFATLVKQQGLRPSGMSKYCTGIVLTGLAPKWNMFKESLLRVERLQAAA